MLLLGNFVFAGFEIPSELKGLLSGKQMLAVKKQIGGQRVIDAMGPDPADISWSGRFQGGNIIDRASQLAAMRDAAQPVQLVCDLIMLTVVVAEFSISYERPWQGTYDIRLVVQPEASADDQSPSLDDQVNQDMLSAMKAASSNISSGAAGL